MSDRVTTFDNIVQDLRDAEQRLVERHQSLQSELKDVEANLNRTRQAQAALGKKQKKSFKNSKPAPTAKFVMGAIKQVLCSGEIIPETELKNKVETILNEQGKSKMGFALRFKEGLLDKSFEETAIGWRLAKSENEDISPEETKTSVDTHR